MELSINQQMNNRGQALLESVLAIPLILIFTSVFFAGTYALLVKHNLDYFSEELLICSLESRPIETCKREFSLATTLPFSEVRMKNWENRTWETSVDIHITLFANTSMSLDFAKKYTIQKPIERNLMRASSWSVF